MATDQTRSVRTTWHYTIASLVIIVCCYAVIVIATMLDTLDAAPAITVTLVSLQVVSGLAAIRFCLFLRVGRGGGLPAPGWVAFLIAPAGAQWVVGLFSGSGAVTGGAALWAATCLIACLVHGTLRWPLILGGAILYVAHALVAARWGGPPPLVINGEVGALIAYGALFPVMVLASVWWWEIVVQLDEHRRTAADLAVTQERLRFASDLHDIQGHHLQVIALKAQLAERLIDVDPVAARDNVHEVGVIAKQALEETRSLVAGYRQVSLDDELENAREVLGASGAECTLRVDSLPTDAAARSALGSVVREGTTNILRHSQARTVTITVGKDSSGAYALDMVNDGSAPPEGPSDGQSAGGSGLAGLRERLAVVGGTLDVSEDGDTFRVRATIPRPGVSSPATSTSRTTA